MLCLGDTTWAIMEKYNSLSLSFVCVVLAFLSGEPGHPLPPRETFYVHLLALESSPVIQLSFFFIFLLL